MANYYNDLLGLIAYAAPAKADRARQLLSEVNNESVLKNLYHELEGKNGFLWFKGTPGHGDANRVFNFLEAQYGHHADVTGLKAVHAAERAGITNSHELEQLTRRHDAELEILEKKVALEGQKELQPLKTQARMLELEGERDVRWFAKKMARDERWMDKGGVFGWRGGAMMEGAETAVHYGSKPINAARNAFHNTSKLVIGGLAVAAAIAAAASFLGGRKKTEELDSYEQPPMMASMPQAALPDPRVMMTEAPRPSQPAQDNRPGSEVDISQIMANKGMQPSMGMA